MPVDRVSASAPAAQAAAPQLRTSKLLPLGLRPAQTFGLNVCESMSSATLARAERLRHEQPRQ